MAFSDGINGSKIVIGKAVPLNTIIKTAAKIINKGFCAIWVSTQTAIAKASCLLYAKIKALYDGVEFKQSDFALQADILSSTARQVASNSKFFFFGNGDVSTDGKTIIKQTAYFKADNSLACNENYVVCNSANFSYSDIVIWKIGSDGTLTYIREFARSNSYGNTQIINGRLFVTGGSGGGQGIYYLDESNFETETAMTFLSGAEVKKVAYDSDTEQYIIFRPDGVQISDDISDIYSQTLLTFTGGDITGGKMLEGKLTVYTGNEFSATYYIHQTVIGSGIINTITLPISLQYQKVLDLQKVANQYVLIVNNGFNGINYYYLAPSLSSFNADNDGVGYALANIGTNYVMVTDTNDILLSEEVKQISTKSFKIGSEILATVADSTGIMSASVDKETFESIVSDTDGRTFTFDGTDWYLGEDIVDLTDYGITYEGTATTDDEIIISYYQAVITYYKLADGSAVCMPDQQTDLDKIFSEYGIVAFFVLDLENETLKTIRNNTDGYLYLYIGGNYVEETTEEIPL